MERSAAALLVCLWFTGVTGCEADHPCDNGQTYKQGSCVPAAKAEARDAGPNTKEDAAAESNEDASASGNGGGTDCKEDQAKVLGTSCMNDEGCNCAAPYCAVMPGQTTGYCTLYCKPSPDDCPSGYRCFDLSALGVQGIEPFCIAK
jgi:hypothetical protein